MVARVQPDRKQLPLVLLRLLCLLPTGLPVRSVDFNRGTDNITVRQGDTAILSSLAQYFSWVPKLYYLLTATYDLSLGLSFLRFVPLVDSTRMAAVRL
uniref:Uncharacterized protein n=1 Tax=Rangifer tarandus platyrhynchus TaxID=3082113 RepID=A0ACB0F982_RANTA|nr:unnamed protein product [Rangifer tarandus platyrhynchus]